MCVCGTSVSRSSIIIRAEKQNGNASEFRSRTDNASSKTIKNIVENLREISEDGVQIATLAQVLVNDNPLLADRLQFVLSVEIEDKLRREKDASKV